MQSTLNRLPKDLRPGSEDGQPDSHRYKRIFHYFGLRENPFNISPDPRYLSFTPQIREALDAITYGIQTRQSLMLLTGEVGTGKTTLIYYLLGWLREQQVPTSFIFNSRLNVSDLLEFVLFDFGIVCESKDKGVKRSLLNAWLLPRYRPGKTPVLIVDEAQGLSYVVLEEIRRLLNLETSQQKLLQIVLVGQPELEEKLARPELRQLQQRITVHCRIGPLNSAETEAYIRRRLHVAGAQDEPIFLSDSVNAVHRYSCGIPRVINMLCEHALINAYTDEIRPVTPEIVNEVAREFQFDKLPPLDARLGFNKTGGARAISIPSTPTITRVHSVGVAKSAPTEHGNTSVSHVPVSAVQNNTAAAIQALIKYGAIAKASMEQPVSAWHRWMLNPLLPLSSYPWRRWLDKNIVMLRFPTLHQTATSVLRWLQQPIGPVRARHRTNQGLPPARPRRQISFARVRDEIRKEFTRFLLDAKARS